MKKNITGNLSISKLNLLIAFITLIASTSCSKDESKSISLSGAATVNFNIKDIIFESTAELGNKNPLAQKFASNIMSPNSLTDNAIQTNTVQLNKDFYLFAELTAEESPKNSSQKNNPLKAAVNAPIATNIIYKIAVFDENGIFVLDRNYARGQETPNSGLQLDAGKTYTFVVYSINSTTTIPNITFTDSNNRTLANASVDISGVSDFMYFKRDMPLVSESVNYLDVILKHKLSQITTTIDASLTGYNISSVSSNFTPHNSTAKIKLVDGIITRTGTVGNVPLVFPTLNSAIVISNPTIINADANSSSSFTIASISVGSLTQTNITPFTDLIISPGVKYNMKLNIIPSDEYLTHEGLPAVRINGQIWMRHNLGVNTILNPDPTTIESNLHGNYYQWGVSRITGTGTASTQNSNYNGSNGPAVNAWNTGTATNPIKATADPCPVGYRVPTEDEFRALISNVITTDFNGSGTYNKAKILTSIRNSSIKLTIPKQGRLTVAGNQTPYQAIGIESRGTTMYLWTSTSIANSISRIVYVAATTGNFSYSRLNNRSTPVVSNNIRCIATTQ